MLVGCCLMVLMLGGLCVVFTFFEFCCWWFVVIVWILCLVVVVACGYLFNLSCLLFGFCFGLIGLRLFCFTYLGVGLLIMFVLRSVDGCLVNLDLLVDWLVDFGWCFAVWLTFVFVCRVVVLAKDLWWQFVF